MLAERLHSRPSALADVTDPYAAYCLDEACVLAEAWQAPAPEPGPRPATRMINGNLPVGEFGRE